MSIKIALAGNPNSGKTTLFNALTGSNQFVGNWPGVTVEKKEGKLKQNGDVIITDLPGIYSLSPYTLEEVVARNYLINERPDAILNIVDGSNLERNLYLTTQLQEIGIPVVIAINMMDVVRKRGDKIDTERLSRELGCKIVEISALKSDGILQAAEVAIEAAKSEKPSSTHNFSGSVEHAIAHIEEAAVHDLEEERQRWYAIKIFERDERVLEALKISDEKLAHIEKDIKRVEDEFDDDAESIITNERYVYIAQLMKTTYKKKNAGKLTTSDKIDRVVTNRWAALPIFALVMFLVYFISVSTVGTWVTDFTNDGLFGDGWHLFGIDGELQEATDAHTEEYLLSGGDKVYEITDADGNIVNVSYTYTPSQVDEYLKIAEDAGVVGAQELREAFAYDSATGRCCGDLAAFEEAYASFAPSVFAYFTDAGSQGYGEDAAEYVQNLDTYFNDALFALAPDPAEWGVWVPGLGVLAERGLNKIGCWEWLTSLIVDGIIGGVGAVLGFVPQMLVLFLLLAFLEACGYMSRIAFVMDRIFRKFGLSGKSFIPMLVGTGCGVPGIMASRTIENERDRRMTIMTTTFVPCGAKLPVIALVASAAFGGAWWLAPTAYFIGIAAVVVSGIILKKTKRFAGEPSPFVMELPAYHMPSPKNLLHSMWERGWEFIKKAGTIILLSSVVIWIASSFGFVGGRFTFSTEMAIADSVLGKIGFALKWLFAPLGFDSIEATVATFMGLVAKEEIVGVFGVLEFSALGSALSAFSFLVFNLLCAPCFAAIGAIRREMNSTKWTWFAIGYQCALAYAVSYCIYQIGSLISNFAWWRIPTSIVAFAIIGFAVYMIAKPYRDSTDRKLKKL